MENSYLMVPSTMAHRRFDFNDAEDAVIIEDEPVKTKACVNFLEANTNAISLDELTSTCVVPTWGNQELTISHQDFISTVHDAARSFFSGETVNEPDIRELCVGGVRNYNDLNLYRQAKGVEKFSVFIGWRVSVCSNQVLTGQGVGLQLEVMNTQQLWVKVMELIQHFNPASDIYLMKNLSNSYLTETQFAQIVGRMRLYQALPNNYQKQVPKLLITDSQINNVCRDFYGSRNFGMKDNRLSMWDFHNLLTESNKSSYIDSYLQRAVNATEVSVGINNALHGDTTYSWFLG